MRSVAVSILILFSLLNNAFPQDYSTWGDIYDYDVGDIFHYEYSGSGGGSGVHGFKNAEIIDKHYSAGYDTVYYTQFTKELYQVWYGDTIYEEIITTVRYTNLNSLAIADTVYYYPTMYNGRKISHYFTLYSIYEMEDKDLVDGCGMATRWYRHVHPPFSDYEINLIYFKKGDEEWGTPNTLVGISEIKNHIISLKCYPNPFTTSTTFEYDLAKPGDVQFTIYNVQGQIVDRMQEKQGKRMQRVEWTAEELPKGLYYLVLSSEKVTSAIKMIKL